MRFVVELGNVVGTLDKLIELELDLEQVRWDLDSPDWYWFDVEWNRLRTLNINLQHRIRVISKQLDKEHAEAYSCG